MKQNVKNTFFYSLRVFHCSLEYQTDDFTTMKPNTTRQYVYEQQYQLRTSLEYQTDGFTTTKPNTTRQYVYAWTITGTSLEYQTDDFTTTKPNTTRQNVYEQKYQLRTSLEYQNDGFTTTNPNTTRQVCVWTNTWQKSN